MSEPKVNEKKMVRRSVAIALGAAFGLVFGFTIPSMRKSKSTSP
jgi:predicted Co/Zn/Cd cation transporter (cation efflux family)